MRYINIEDSLGSSIQNNCLSNGNCSGCGGCCSNFLYLDKSEISRIHKFLKKHEVKEQSNVVLNTSIDMTCPFRDNKNKKCLIYGVRPDICRRFQCNQSMV